MSRREIERRLGLRRAVGHPPAASGAMSWSCYLARPIDADLRPDGFADTRVRSFTLIVREMLEGAGAVVYDPAIALLQNPDGNPFAQRVHNAALEAADVILAYLPDGVPSIGVPIEIERAAQMGKPVAVVGGGHALHSTVLAALLGRAISRFGADEVGAAIEWLRTQATASWGLVDHVEWFLQAVHAEIDQARDKHPRSDDEDWTTANRWFAIWIEEVVELIQAWNDNRSGEPDAIDRESVREELVQTAAMACRLWMSLRPEGA